MTHFKVGDIVSDNGRYPYLKYMWKESPSLEITGVMDAPKYAGGQFVFVRVGGKEFGLYSNGVTLINSKTNSMAQVKPNPWGNDEEFKAYIRKDNHTVLIVVVVLVAIVLFSILSH